MTKHIHVAIMRKSWNLTPKILSGEKTIESRWYKNKYSPWGNITKGDVVYFKDSGNPVTLKANVKKVLQFKDLTPKHVLEILNRYGKADGIAAQEINSYYEKFKDKKYCLLIFLTNVSSVEPFDINKTGYGAMAAWITTSSLEKIKVS